MVLNIEQIRSLLEPLRLTVVARDSGVSYPVIKKLADGYDNVSVATLKKVSAYLVKTMVVK